VAEEALKELEHLSAYPMPLESPAAIFTSAISSPEGMKNEVSNIIFEPWKAAFNTGQLVNPDKTFTQQFLKT
jgi:hypothetical protein